MDFGLDCAEQNSLRCKTDYLNLRLAPHDYEDEDEYRWRTTALKLWQDVIR